MGTRRIVNAVSDDHCGLNAFEIDIQTLAGVGEKSDACCIDKDVSVGWYGILAMPWMELCICRRALTYQLGQDSDRELCRG